MHPKRTMGEATLLLATTSCGLTRPERRQRVARAANRVLAEALCPGYRLEFHQDQGLKLLTPSGLMLWFSVAHEGEGFTTLVVDLTADLTRPDDI